MGIPEGIQALIDAQVRAAPARYDDLRVLILNGTLKRSPEPSNTEGLLAIPKRIFDGVGAHLDVVRPVDHMFPPGIWPDMAEHGWERDGFPTMYRPFVVPADIVILASPIWLGDQRSLTRLIIERLYGWSAEVNASGQWSYYGTVGGAVITGNEDGARHVVAQVLFALQHIGFTVPPQADCCWDGEAGPGPSYLDGEAGTKNAWTTRNAVFMTWNLLHLARLLKDVGGVPPHGNDSRDWDLSRPDHPNPGTGPGRASVACAHPRGDARYGSCQQPGGQRCASSRSIARCSATPMEGTAPCSRGTPAARATTSLSPRARWSAA